jgi:purine-nucleoside phosphorylase
MGNQLLYDRIQAAAGVISHHYRHRPDVAIVLGSGLGHLADLVVHHRVEITYDEIPGFEPPGVEGHAGRVVCGDFAGVNSIIYQGRFHYYEGHDLDTVTLPTRVAAALGTRLMILTAATGGIAKGLGSGDLCVLSDHINMLGFNPLRGRHDDRLGKRFPDMTQVYSTVWRDLAMKEAEAMQLQLRSAIYAAMPGPSYETPAEVRMLRGLGADVVGMSTVPEAIVARASGMDVLAFAMVTNAASGTGDDPTAEIDHKDVLEIAKSAGNRLGQLIERIIASSFQPH